MKKENIKKTVYMNQKNDAAIKKYIAMEKSEDKNYNYSELINKAVEEFFNIELTNKNLNLISNIISKNIKTEIKKNENKNSELILKNLSSTYTIEEFLIRIINYLFHEQLEDSQEFIRLLLADSRATSDEILKKGISEEQKIILEKIFNSN